MLETSRRNFLKIAVSAGATGAVSAPRASGAPNAMSNSAHQDTVCVLVDIPNCIGCRRCEFACQRQAGFDVPPVDAFDDKSVFQQHRRPGPGSYTTVNRFENPGGAERPVYVKANCLHCKDPACVSACLVGALRKNGNGAVTYDAGKCMGCRYCMVACPFQIPAYEYDNALTPQVRKCTFCFDHTSEGEAPACVKICPNEALIYGKRSELLKVAHERIKSRPDLYVDHVYGEHEAGGTSWLYLSSVPFSELGFLTLGSTAPPRLTEAIQHGVFKFFVPPLALYGLLGLIMWLTRRREEVGAQPLGEDRDRAGDERADQDVFQVWDEEQSEPADEELDDVTVTSGVTWQ